jgi:uncharacterized protein (DUF1684 family)
MSGSIVDVVTVVDWRRQVFGLYADVRRLAESSPEAAHDRWRAARDALFAQHPATPLLFADRAAFAALPTADYDPSWRFEPEVTATEPERRDVPTGTDGVVSFERIGAARLPFGTLDVWRLMSYGGGIFVPVKDALAGKSSGTYGGGRYLLDTAKGADLGAGKAPGSLVLDFNFAYNPSCAYDPAWQCPLAPAGNVVDVQIPVGELGWPGHPDPAGQS